jgi:hypothetical protein
MDVLRHGIKHGSRDVNLFYGTPSPGNVKAAETSACPRRRPAAHVGDDEVFEPLSDVSVVMQP